MTLNFKKTDHLHATKYIKTATEISYVVALKKVIKTFTRDIYGKYHYKTCYRKKESHGVKFTKTVNPIKCFMYVLDTKLFLAIAI